MAQLTPIAIAALGLLSERPRHPYEMYQLLLDRESTRVLKVRPGTLYHTVGRLSDDGLVRPVGVDRDGNRPERTTFEITPEGRRELSRRLAEMLSTPAAEFPQFTLALSEAHNLSRDEAVACLRARIATLHDEEREIAERFDRHRLRSLPRLFWIEHDYDRMLRRAEVAWLEAVVADVDGGRLPWTDSDEVRAFTAAKSGTCGGAAEGAGRPGVGIDVVPGG